MSSEVWSGISIKRICLCLLLHKRNPGGVLWGSAALHRWKESGTAESLSRRAGQLGRHQSSPKRWSEAPFHGNDSLPWGWRTQRNQSLHRLCTFRHLKKPWPWGGYEWRRPTQLFLPVWDSDRDCPAPLGGHRKEEGLWLHWVCWVWGRSGETALTQFAFAQFDLGLNGSPHGERQGSGSESVHPGWIPGKLLSIIAMRCSRSHRTLVARRS